MWFQCKLAIVVACIIHHQNMIIMGLCDRADHGSQVGSDRSLAQSSSSLLPAVSSPSSRFSAVVIETVAMTPGARK